MCRRPACEEPPVAQRGPYAGLCIAHQREASQARSEALRGKPRGGRNGSANGARAALALAAPAGGIALSDAELARTMREEAHKGKQRTLRSAIEELLPVADMLEEKAAAHAMTRAELAAVVEVWREKLTVIGRIAQSKVNVGTGRAGGD